MINPPHITPSNSALGNCLTDLYNKLPLDVSRKIEKYIYKRVTCLFAKCFKGPSVTGELAML